MVLNYNFENFMSFRERAEFSMLAPDTEEKKQVSRFLCINGANVRYFKDSSCCWGKCWRKIQFCGEPKVLKEFFYGKWAYKGIPKHGTC